ncbi:hypothetical protein TCAL_13345 [Tigriopus californicus]|uniref:Uncharacterized protein n=1 Tax=Tigriopus californicus TaxID=6832 RepID=A0A553PD38_TIGCA|nr:uncharacterized protein LOC131893417 [Tigriopus californicus]XP_059099423.1 uncharacterized protein LOC131893417 [Tigriopus californicus]TRY75586.1 hypothetical protein TCAL_13345 [Tigriopus californicus]
MSKYQKIIAVFLLLAGIVIFSLSIVGIVHAQYTLSQHLFIVILVFTIFTAILFLASHCMTTGNDNYNVNQGAANNVVVKPSKKKTGQINAGFPGTDPKENKTDRWVSNYVPYEGYPSGRKAEMNVVDEQKNGSSNWKKNYVPHEEEEKKDSTKD